MLSVEELITVIGEEGDLDSAAVRPETVLSSLGLTSYAMMRLLLRVEDQFECELTSDDLARVMTMSIAELRDAVERSLAAQT